MTIDMSGRWWVGSEPRDARIYLIAYRAEGYPIHETRLCECPCGSIEFELFADRDEGVAKRLCACGREHLICDSQDVWDEAQSEKWSCTECGYEKCNVAVAFSLYEPDKPGQERDVHWISVGNRCANCGTLGCFVDWKVGWGPSHGLLEQG